MKTRTKLFIACIIIGYMGLFSFNASAQSYKLDNNNKVIQVKKDSTVKQADKVHSIVNGVTFYQGSKGGVYCWRVSKLTGKKYKYYLPKQK